MTTSWTQGVLILICPEENCMDAKGWMFCGTSYKNYRGRFSGRHSQGRKQGNLETQFHQKNKSFSRHIHVRGTRSTEREADGRRQIHSLYCYKCLQKKIIPEGAKSWVSSLLTLKDQGNSIAGQKLGSLSLVEDIIMILRRKTLTIDLEFDRR